jgi:hypothetical protein
VVGIQDIFNILGYAMALRGELGDISDFTVLEFGLRVSSAMFWLASASLVLRQLFAHII